MEFIHRNIFIFIVIVYIISAYVLIICKLESNTMMKNPRTGLKLVIQRPVRTESPAETGCQ